MTVLLAVLFKALQPEPTFHEAYSPLFNSSSRNHIEESGITALDLDLLGQMRRAGVRIFATLKESVQFCRFVENSGNTQFIAAASYMRAGYIGQNKHLLMR